MHNNFIKLESCFEMLKKENEEHLVIYGSLEKEIKESIETYRVKTLFLHSKIKTNFDNLIDKSYINFEIIPITSYEKGDSGDILMTNYGGIIAIAYY